MFLVPASLRRCVDCSLWLVPAVILSAAPLDAGEAKDPLDVSGILAAGYHASITGNSGLEDFDGGGVPLQLVMAYRVSERADLNLKFTFAAGGGARERSSFVLPHWAADLEGDVVGINGRDRDYLLTAWYRRSFTLGGGRELAITGGIVDATDYVDRNAFANDEITQYMHTALVNGPNFFAPSYDIGAAVEFASERFSATAVVINVGENESGSPWTFFATELGLHVGSRLGRGNFRVVLGGSSDDFVDAADGTPAQRGIAIVSCDQELGSRLGTWIRAGVQDDATTVDYAHLYSGGIVLAGEVWGREADDLGIAFARLDGGNTGIDSTDVWELYLRFQLESAVHLTADVQFVRDAAASGDAVDAMLVGTRVTAAF